MVKTDTRIEFARKWYRRGSEELDPFDSFFCLWISLVVFAQIHQTLTQYIDGCNTTDRTKIMEYFYFNEDKIIKALENQNSKMIILSRRKGSQYENSIVDSSRDLREKFKKLSEHYNGLKLLKPHDHIEYVAELLNKIRNNVFHGNKAYDDANDIELLNLVNPILLSILEHCEDIK